MSNEDAEKIPSFREEFFQKMENHYKSSCTGIHGIEFLIPTYSDKIDIYVDNNDYLHLSCDPRLTSSRINDVVLEKDETSSQSFISEERKSDNMMSAVFLKPDACLFQVSDMFAKKILGKECVYVTQSGYVANFDLLRSIIIPSKTHVYIDTGAHESLWQGASQGIIHKIKHNSLEDLEQKLEKYGSGLIIVDSLYSSKGTIAKLPEICDLKERYDCMLLVDEAHSIGLYGPHGGGLAALMNVTDRIDFITGSLAKAFCVRAGFIAGRVREISYMRQISSHSIYSTTLMNPDLRRLQRSVQLIYDADNERDRLLDISKTIRDAALKLEFDIEQPILPSPILCLVGGPNPYSKKLQIYFENAGIAAPIFIAPATPVNRSILRISLNAGLSDQDVARIINTLELIAQNHLEFPYTFKAERA